VGNTSAYGLEYGLFFMNLPSLILKKDLVFGLRLDVFVNHRGDSHAFVYVNLNRTKWVLAFKATIKTIMISIG
jgi:hypothetical protein